MRIPGEQDQKNRHREPDHMPLCLIIPDSQKKPGEKMIAPLPGALGRDHLPVFPVHEYLKTGVHKDRDDPGNDKRRDECG